MAQTVDTFLAEHGISFDAIDLDDNNAEHHGVKGQRWGVRRDERALSPSDMALNMAQRSQVRVASTISAIASMGMATNAAAAMFQLQNRWERLQAVNTIIREAEDNPLLTDAAREGLRQTKSSLIKAIIGSAMATTAITVAIGVVSQRTAKAYFAPLHKVYSSAKPKINKDLRKLSADIKAGKRPKMTSSQYNKEVSSIVQKHMTMDKSNILKPFHELARSQLGLQYNSKQLKIKLEKLPNTDLMHKMTIVTPDGLVLVKAVRAVKHADAALDTAFENPSNDLEFYFDYKFDKDGFITEFYSPTIEVAHDIFEGKLNLDEVATRYGIADHSEGVDMTGIEHTDLIHDFLEEQGVELAHFGTKGMRWGVRNDDGASGSSGSSGHSFASVKEAIADVAAKSGGKIYGLNSRPPYKGQDLNKNPKLKAAYHKEVQTIFKAQVKRTAIRTAIGVGVGAATALTGIGALGALGAFGVSSVTSGSTVPTGGRGGFDMVPYYSSPGADVQYVPNLAKHAEPDTFKFYVQYDDKGYITKVELRPMELMQSEDIRRTDEFLEHHGIKGQRWGIRRKDGSDGTVSGGMKKTGGGPMDDGMSEDAKRFVRTRSKAGHEQSDAEIKAALKRQADIDKYNELFGGDPVLRARLADLRAEQEIATIQSQIHPSKVQRLIRTATAGYNAYTTLDEKTGGALTAGIKKAAIAANTPKARGTGGTSNNGPHTSTPALPSFGKHKRGVPTTGTAAPNPFGLTGTGQAPRGQSPGKTTRVTIGPNGKLTTKLVPINPTNSSSGGHSGKSGSTGNTSGSPFGAGVSKGSALESYLRSRQDDGRSTQTDPKHRAGAHKK